MTAAKLPDRVGVLRDVPLWATDANGNQTGLQRPNGTVEGVVVSVGTSRSLTAADDGCVIDVTANGVTLTVPVSLPTSFACIVLPTGTTSVASSGGTLLNGATSTIAREAGGNASFAILPRTTANSYVVTGI